MYNRKEYFDMRKVFVHGLGQTPESSSIDEKEKCVCPDLVEGVK